MKTLNQLASRLASNLLPLAVRNHSFFVNTIPKDILLPDGEWPTSVINSLLSTIVLNARETCIRISARKIGESIVMEIREGGTMSMYALACGLQEVQSMAEKVGGNLNISMQRSKNTIIAFCFPVVPLAA